MTEGGEDQVGTLPVEDATPEDRLRLHQQHGLMRIVEEMRAELVSEDPTPQHQPIVPVRLVFYIPTFGHTVWSQSHFGLSIAGHNAGAEFG
ncbi:hypothetical protein GCM10027290_64240 [Micromonospora sonneratiae]